MSRRIHASLYIAYGRAEDQDGMYWVAAWTEVGPSSPEQLYDTRDAAAQAAHALATMLGLEAVECDEHGPLPKEER